MQQRWQDYRLSPSSTPWSNNSASPNFSSILSSRRRGLLIIMTFWLLHILHIYDQLFLQEQQWYHIAYNETLLLPLIQAIDYKLGDSPMERMWCPTDAHDKDASTNATAAVTSCSQQEEGNKQNQVPHQHKDNCLPPSLGVLRNPPFQVIHISGKFWNPFKVDARNKTRVQSFSHEIQNFERLIRQSKVYELVDDGQNDMSNSTSAPATSVSSLSGRDDRYTFDTSNAPKRLQHLDELHIYAQTFPAFIAQDSVWYRHLEFQRNNASQTRRGAGYWFWKAPLILYHLQHSMSKSINGHDFLVYTDVDRTDILYWLSPLLQTMMDRNADLYLEQHNDQTPEDMWTKPDIMHQLCGEGNFLQSPQYNANAIVLRKTNGTLQFIQEWVQLVQDFHLLSDNPPSVRMGRARIYKDNRHDQSLLSTNLKCQWHESRKEEFTPTCLHDWKAYTFDLQHEYLSRKKDFNTAQQ